MKATKFTRGKLILIFSAASALGVLAYYATTVGRLVPEDELRNPEAVAESSEETVETATEAKEVTVYSLVPGQTIEFESRVEVVPEGTDPFLYAVNSYIDSLGYESSARAKKTSIEADLAKIDFGTGIQKGYGSMEEVGLVRGLLATASQFEGVQRLQILVDGSPIESFGHLEIMDPIPVSERFVADP